MSIFTKRHYEFLTEITKQIIESIDGFHSHNSYKPKFNNNAEIIANVMADNLANESFGFNKQLFLDNVLKP